MNTKQRTDDKLERILHGRPLVAYNLESTKREATRRAKADKEPRIVCMDSKGKLAILLGDDYQKKQGKLTPLVYCFTNGKRSNIKSKGKK